MAIQPFALQARTAEINLPSQALAGGERLKALQNNNAMMAGEMQDKQNLDQAYRESGGDINAMMKNPNLGFEAGTKLQSLSSENVKAQAAAQAAKIDQGLKMLDAGAQIVGGANDQASWSAARQQMGQMFGADAMANLPEQFDPAVQKRLMEQSLSHKDKLELQKMDIMQQRADQNAYYQNARLDQFSQGLALRGQDSGGDGGGKPKNQIIYDQSGQGYVIDVNDPSLTPRPIGMGGAPAGQGGADGGFKKPITAPTASEDERKAAGWLNQARLASKQMQEALLEDPNAANKPFKESLGERLPFVREEDINAQRSPQRQRFTAAASSFSEAVLRAATGAGVNESEAKQKIAELTPVYGESDASIKDKMARQEMYLQSLEQRAGRAAPKEPASTGSFDPSAFHK